MKYEVMFSGAHCKWPPWNQRAGQALGRMAWVLSLETSRTWTPHNISLITWHTAIPQRWQLTKDPSGMLWKLVKGTSNSLGVGRGGGQSCGPKWMCKPDSKLKKIFAVGFLWLIRYSRCLWCVRRRLWLGRNSGTCLSVGFWLLTRLDSQGPS